MNPDQIDPAILAGTSAAGAEGLLASGSNGSLAAAGQAGFGQENIQYAAYAQAGQAGFDQSAAYAQAGQASFDQGAAYAQADQVGFDQSAGFAYQQGSYAAGGAVDAQQYAGKFNRTIISA